MVGVDVEVVGRRVFPGDAVAESHALGNHVVVVVLGSVQMVDHLVAAVGGAGQAVAELALEPEVLDGLQLGIDAGVQGIELVQVAAAVVVVHADRVLRVVEEGPAFAVADLLVVEAEDVAVGVGLIDREERVRADGVVQRAVVDVALGDAAVLAEAEVDGLAHLQDVQVVALDDHVVGVHPERVAAVLGVHRLDLVVAEDTVLAGVGETHRELVLGGTAGHVQGVVLAHRALVVHFLHPVGSLPGTVRDGLVQLGGQLGGEVHLGQAAVLAGQVVELDVLLRVHHVGQLGQVLGAVEAVIGDDHAAFLALLGGHEHDAVRGAGAVDGGRRGVLQDVDGLDVVRVQGVDVAAGHAVDDIQRLGIADGADTADVHLVPAARLAGILGDGDTRALALEGAEGGGGVQSGEVVTLDLDGRTGEELLLLDAVADDHGLVQLVEVGIQDDVHDGAGADGDFLADIADDFHGEDAVGRRRNRVLSVKVGRRPVGGSLDDDRCERDGVAVLTVCDGARHGPVLRAGAQREQAYREGQEEFVKFHECGCWLLVESVFT